MPGWSEHPPSTSQNVQDWSWIVQPLEALRERDWFRDNKVYDPPTPLPSPLPEPVGPKRRWPRYSEHMFFGEISAFSEGSVTLAGGAGFWDDDGPNPFAPGDTADYFSRAPYAFVVETSRTDGDVNVNRTLRVDVFGWDIDTGTLSLAPTRDWLTWGLIGSYADLVTSPGLRGFIIPRYGLWWAERWPVPPNPTPEQYRAVVDWSDDPDRRPTASEIRVAAALPSNADAHPAYAGDPEPLLLTPIPSGVFDAVDPDDPATATHELMVWDDSSPRRKTRRLPIKSAGGLVVTLFTEVDEDTELERTVERMPDGSYGTETDADDGGTPWRAWYSDPASGAGAPLNVIVAGGVYQLDRERHDPRTWNRGAGTSPRDDGRAYARLYAHQPDDQLRQIKTIPLTVSWKDETDPDLCALAEENPHDATDVDLWIGVDAACTPADRPLSADYWKTDRAVQVETIRRIPAYVEDKDYTNESVIPWLTVAEAFRVAGVNSQVCTVSAVGSTLSISAITPANFGYTSVGGDDPEYPILVDYSIRYYPGVEDAVYSGQALLTNATTLAVDLSGISSTDITGITGAEIVVTARYTVPAPLEIRHPYSRWIWVPDKDPLFNTIYPSATIVNFEDDGLLGRGTWIERTPDAGYSQISNRADGTPRPFTSGDLARYAGDNWHDPVDCPEAGNGPAMDPIVPYWDRLYTGRVRPPVQTEKVESLYSFTAVAVGPKRLEAASPRWFVYWHSEGTTHVESGDVGDGSDATTTTDPSKLAGEESGAFFDASRWPADRTAYELFTLKRTAEGVTSRRLIFSTSVDPVDGVTIDTDPADPFPDADLTGATYEIAEPFEALRWRGRPIKMTWPDGYVEWGRVQANDDVAVYLAAAPSRALEVGVQARIMNLMPGGVGRITATEPASDDSGNRPDYIPLAGSDDVGSESKFWTAVTGGTDSARMGIATPADFVPKAQNNSETIVRRFGLYTKGQIRNKSLRTEIRKVIDVLSAYKVTTISWHSRFNPATAENNRTTVNAFIDAFYGDYADVDAVYAENLANFQAAPGPGSFTTVGEVDPPPVPHAAATSSYYDSGPGAGSYGAGILCETLTGYAYVTGAAPWPGSSADLYCFAEINAAGDDPGQNPPDAYVAEYTPGAGDPYLYDTRDTASPPTPIETVTSRAFSALGSTMLFRKYQKFALGAPDGAGVRKSGPVGAPSLPPTPAEPPYLHRNSNHLTKGANTDSGFYVTKSIAVVRATALVYHR